MSDYFPKPSSAEPARNDNKTSTMYDARSEAGTDPNSQEPSLFSDRGEDNDSERSPPFVRYEIVSGNGWSPPPLPHERLSSDVDDHFVLRRTSSAPVPSSSVLGQPSTYPEDDDERMQDPYDDYDDAEEVEMTLFPLDYIFGKSDATVNRVQSDSDDEPDEASSIIKSDPAFEADYDESDNSPSAGGKHITWANLRRVDTKLVQWSFGGSSKSDDEANSEQNDDDEGSPTKSTEAPLSLEDIPNQVPTLPSQPQRPVPSRIASSDSTQAHTQGDNVYLQRTFYGDFLERHTPRGRSLSNLDESPSTQGFRGIRDSVIIYRARKPKSPLNRSHPHLVDGSADDDQRPIYSYVPVPFWELPDAARSGAPSPDAVAKAKERLAHRPIVTSSMYGSGSSTPIVPEEARGSPSPSPIVEKLQSPIMPTKLSTETSTKLSGKSHSSKAQTGAKKSASAEERGERSPVVTSVLSKQRAYMATTGELMEIERLTPIDIDSSTGHEPPALDGTGEEPGPVPRAGRRRDRVLRSVDTICCCGLLTRHRGSDHSNAAVEIIPPVSCSCRCRNCTCHMAPGRKCNCGCAACMHPVMEKTVDHGESLSTNSKSSSSDSESLDEEKAKRLVSSMESSRQSIAPTDQQAPASAPQELAPKPKKSRRPKSARPESPTQQTSATDINDRLAALRAATPEPAMSQVPSANINRRLTIMRISQAAQDLITERRLSIQATAGPSSPSSKSYESSSVRSLALSIAAPSSRSTTPESRSSADLPATVEHAASSLSMSPSPLASGSPKSHSPERERANTHTLPTWSFAGLDGTAEAEDTQALIKRRAHFEDYLPVMSTSDRSFQWFQKSTRSLCEATEEYRLLVGRVMELHGSTGERSQRRILLSRKKLQDTIADLENIEDIHREIKLNRLRANLEWERIPYGGFLPMSQSRYKDLRKRRANTGERLWVDMQRGHMRWKLFYDYCAKVHGFYWGPYDPLYKTLYWGFKSVNLETWHTYKEKQATGDKL